MPERAARPHGQIGFASILGHACNQCKVGSIDDPGDHTLRNPGTIQNVFGRLCGPVPELSDTAIKDLRAALKTLADDMKEVEAQAQDGPAPAGTAFLGQFIDHDLTLDATTELAKQAMDVSKITNFRTPRLDLDCVYGAGPEVTPFLYKGEHLIFGTDVNPLDLQRNGNGTALIGDPRNDENLFVNQVHGQQFVAKHNEFADQAKGDAHDKYVEARAKLTALYHSRIVYEFLPDVIAADVYTPLREAYEYGVTEGHLNLQDSGPIDWATAPDMPVEFSAAAFRFGHSMVRQTYKLNSDFPDVSIFARDSDMVKLEPFSAVAPEHSLNMGIYFGKGAQRSRPIDTHIPASLIALPQGIVNGTEANLALRNMERAQITFRIPSGDAMAKRLNLPVIAPDTRIAGSALEGNTPLWYYILAEAETSSEPGKLGPLGGLIVGGVILNLLLRGRKPKDMPAAEAMLELIA